MAKQTKEASDFVSALKKLYDATPDYLSDYPMLVLSTQSDLQRIIGKLSVLGGLETQAKHLPQFQPITEFMGEPINAPKPVAKEDLSISEKDLQIKMLNEKADRLEAALDAGAISNQEILESYQADTVVLRVVAKRAGLEHYKDAPVNDQLISEIRMARQDNRDLQARKLAETTKLNNETDTK